MHHQMVPQRERHREGEGESIVCVAGGGGRSTDPSILDFAAPPPIAISATSSPTSSRLVSRLACLPACLALPCLACCGIHRDWLLPSPSPLLPFLFTRSLARALVRSVRTLAMPRAVSASFLSWIFPRASLACRCSRASTLGTSSWLLDLGNSFGN